MEEVFKLSRRSGSGKWQVRKRWPTDVAATLTGEFTASTGEEEKAKALDRLPLLAAEYQRRVGEARRDMAKAPKADLTEAEAHRMAAQFYQSQLPRFITRRTVDPLSHKELLAAAKDQLGSARDMLGRNDYWPVLAAGRTIVGQAGLSLPDEAPALEYLNRMLMRAFVELHVAAVEHLSGNADYTPKDSAMRDVPEEEPQASGRTLEDLLTAYEADKSEGWSGSSKKAAVPVFRVLRDVFPGREVTTITREDARGVVTLLQGLPANLGKRKELAGLSVPQAVVKAKALKLETIRPKTINDGYLIHIAAIFNWARREQWIPSSPFEGLSVFDPVSDEDRRDPFTVAQLNTLFATETWAEPWSGADKQAGAFWVPLLCLFHGLRNGEAAGLRVEDIGEEDGIAVLHIRAYEQRQLKTAGSRGSLPIHSELIKLDFLGYVGRRKAAGELLLFPEGTANSRGQVGAKLGERFSAKVKALGFEGRKLGMHALRHNFEDRLREAELPERTALALARRTEPGSSRIYGDGLSARQKASAIERVVYPGLDLSHLYVAGTPDGAG